MIVPSKKKRKAGRCKNVVKLESLKQLNLNAAGLDIGSAEIWACVPEERDEQPVRRFDTFTTDLHALVDWLDRCSVETVAMESTGVLAPHNDISGGKVLKSRTLKSKNRAAQALRTAAQSVGRSNSALGAYYRRMRARHGAPKAITATAHKLARIFYHMLKYGQEYNDPGQDYYELKYQERVIKNLQRKAKEFGMELVPQHNVS